jgi:hypothetical protein
MRLVSTLDEEGVHGHQAPRPYVINPPLEEQTAYAPGERFVFDLLLAGDAADLFPYVVLALDRLGYEGLGARVDGDREGFGKPSRSCRVDGDREGFGKPSRSCRVDGDREGFGKPSRSDRTPRRGTARVTRIDALHPLTGETGPVLRPNSRTVNVPALPITHADVLAVAERLPVSGDITLHFITPMRLVDHEQLVKVPYFRPLLHRLIERVKSLAENFGGGPVPYDIRALRDLADGVALVENHTSWLDLKGYSTRLGREQMIGGLVGRATYRATDWTPFRPWLVWGTILHAGKNAVKGDGWFGIEAGNVRVGLPGFVTG